MFRLVVAVALSLLSAPVFAQEKASTASLFAEVAAGFVDGATISMSPVGKATIRETRPGVFDVAGTGKQRSLFTFAETEPCVVQLTIKVTPPQPGHVIAVLAVSQGALCFGLV